VLADGRVIRGEQSVASPTSPPMRPSGEAARGEGYWGGTPRSVAFNAGLPRRDRRGHGELRILRSIHAADAGVVVNPSSAAARSRAASPRASAPRCTRSCGWTSGTVTSDILRQYHVPTFADIPRSEVHFAQTSDVLGPLGAKSMSESPFNPIAPALAAAIRDAPASG
jgi:hypothetical protein